MDERRDKQSQAEPGAQPHRGGLPTAQQAHLDYNRHVEGAGRVRPCPRCSDIDRDRCLKGEELWEAWNAAINDAYRRLHGGRA